MAITVRRIALWVLGAAALGAGIYVSFREQPVPVDLAQVTSGPMEVTIDASGMTRIRNIFEVSAPVAGTAQRSPVKIGDKVQANVSIVAIIEPGQPVFLDARSRIQAEAAVNEAEAALRLADHKIAAAEASHKYARDQFGRAKTLTESGTLSANALDEARLLFEQAQTALVSTLSERSLRQSTLDRSLAMLIEPGANSADTAKACCIEVIAPVDGSILSVTSLSAHSVTAGAPLVSVGALGDLELVVDLLSSDVVGIRNGATAYVERWGGNKTLLAQVSRVEPTAFTKISALGISEQRVQVVLDFTSPKSDYRDLGDGFRVFIRVVEWQSDDAMQIPISALFRKDGNWMVFRVVDGIAKGIVIEVGQRNSSVAEVLGGLSVGDSIITHPSDRVAEGVMTINRDEM